MSAAERVDAPEAGSTAYRVAEAMKAHARKWIVFPLKPQSKLPRFDKWQNSTLLSIPVLNRWAHAGNLGLLCGEIVGIDIDPRKGGSTEGLNLPRTVTVDTGGGGQHLFYWTTAEIHNSAGKLAPGVDVRGKGGFLVFVGSIHPDTGKPYRWAPGLSPDEVPMAELPAAIVERLVAKPRARYDWTAPAGESVSPTYAPTALAAETQAVRQAQEGTRNDTLNRSAYNLFQLVGAGLLNDIDVTSQLTGAALSIGLSEREVKDVIDRARVAGTANPRRVTVAAQAPLRLRAPDTLPRVLIPGHWINEKGDEQRVGAEDFTRDVADARPRTTVYDLSSTVAEIVGEPGRCETRAVPVDRMRGIVDRHVQLFRYVKGEDDAITARFIPCNKDHAALAAANALALGLLPRIETITRYPVLLLDGTISRPGWNEAQSIYYDEPPDLAGLEPEDSPDVPLIEDIIRDFPFRDPASIANFFGALLTPLVRPAILGHVPMHLVTAPIEGSGKTMLVDDVIGRIVLGEPIGATMLGEKNKEVKDLITSKLLSGTRLANFDNLHDNMESEVLSALITNEWWEDRAFFTQRIVRIKNTMVVYATGNNVRANREQARRTVPIFLEPQTGRPENRSGLRDLASYVPTVRRRALAALLGMIRVWQRAGSPPGPRTLGSFDPWSQVVGGILAQFGFTDWLGTQDDWIGSADPVLADLEALVEVWATTFGSVAVGAGSLAEVAQRLGLFPHAFARANAVGAVQAFGRVLSKRANAVVGQWQILKTDKNSSSRYQLRRVETPETPVKLPHLNEDAS